MDMWNCILGFTLAMVFGGPLVDVIGIGRIIAIAFVCHVVELSLQ